MFNRIEELIEDIRNGKMVILVDDEDRENEGDIVLAADHVTPQAINFMATEARGLICLSLSSRQIERLALPQMVRDDLNHSPNKTAFTVSIEASSGVTTGISAHDRAHTIRVASNPLALPADVHTPGHIFPIRAQEGGVLRRAGHTEGSIDLAKLAGLNSAAVICEIMNPDGTMARFPDLVQFAKKHELKIGTIVDLIEYRLNNETLVEEVAQIPVPAELGSDLTLKVFRSKVDRVEHWALQKGPLIPGEPALVRMHIDNFTKEIFSGFLANGSSFQNALKKIQEVPSGVIVVLRGNNKAVGLADELRRNMASTSPSSRDSSAKGQMGHRPEADRESRPKAAVVDDRDYGIGAQILRSMGVSKIRLLTNHSERRIGLKAFDLEIIDTVAF